MKYLIATLLLLICSSAMAEEFVYEGDWVTTNRRLDGKMTAVVTYGPEKGKWKSRFYGIWQGVDFDYTVDFTGPVDKLVGKATIDGASYDWQGTISQEAFKATFGGSRYRGHFDMKRKK